MKRLIDKVIAAVVLLPPLYMLIRFVRWSMNQDYQKTEEEI
jgi:hypothetical protein